MTVVLCLLRSRELISIHMPHTWHDVLVADDCVLLGISIHMPHTWHDTLQQSLEDAVRISIHMPHTWHDMFTL